MVALRSEAIVVMDEERRARTVVTARSFVEWIAAGSGDPGASVMRLAKTPFTIGPDASVVDGVLAMGTADTSALAITSDGTVNGRLEAVVTSHDLGQIFADRPVDILSEISRAADVRAIRALNERARAFVLEYLTNAGASEWLARFTATFDAGILQQIIVTAIPKELPACWCLCGAAGRGESLTKVAPQIVLIADENQEPSRWRDCYKRVFDFLNECDYLPNNDRAFDPGFYAAVVSEWQKRYAEWVSDPILKEISRALSLFDLRPIAGRKLLWQQLQETAMSAVNREFLNILANDCLASLPPLTFFQNAVLDESGEETAVFRLNHSTLQPLVDVGRVFGITAKKVFGSSTFERFEMARSILPEQSSIFTEAADSLRVVLWQQGRVGITQGTAGWELPPALLSRYDRQLLKSCFRSILRLLEFTADLQWLKTL
jgi:CBS domain-containing protein